jgi:hypothetical protein
MRSAVAMRVSDRSVTDQRLLKCKHPRLRDALQFRLPSKEVFPPEPNFSDLLFSPCYAEREKQKAQANLELGFGLRILKKLIEGAVAGLRVMTAPI